MFRRFIILTICLLFFVCVIPDIACGLDYSDGDKDVDVAFFELDGYNKISKNGARSGYGYEMLQLIARYETMPYTYKGYDATWTEVINMLRLGVVDIVPAAEKTPELEREFAFSDKSICNAATVLTVKKGNDEIISGDFSTYDGKVFGLLVNNERNESFRKFAKNNDISCKEVFFRRKSEMNKALQSGVIDVAVTSSLISNQGSWVINYFDEVPLYIMMRKDDQTLINKVNRALEKMEIETPNWRADLYEKYFPNYTDQMFYLTSEESELIKKINKEGKVFKVLASPQRYPYSYINAEGEFVGVMFDVFDKLASRIGIKYEILRPKDSKEYMEMLIAGEGEICLDMTPDLYTAEVYHYQVTDTYLTAPFSWLRKSDYYGSINRAARVSSFSQTPAQYYFDNKKIALEYISFPSRDECIEAVRTGRADGYCTYTFLAEKIIFDNERGDLAMEYTPIEAEFTIGVSEHVKHELVAVMNKAVLSLDESLVESSVREHTVLGKQPLTLRRIFYQQPMLIAFMVLTVLAIVLVATFYVMRLRQTREMEATIKEQTLRIRELMQGMLGVLATAIEFRDNDSGDHVRRMSRYTKDLMVLISKTYPEYGISEEDVENIASVALLHDVGKVAIPDAILLKKGRLTPEEFEEMKLHTVKGCDILEKIPNVMEEKVYKCAYDICRYHHERWDGKGYPDALKGEEIPICAQAAAIADVYDALTTERPYKKAFSHEKAVQMILDGECGCFNPKILEIFKQASVKWGEALKES